LKSKDSCDELSPLEDQEKSEHSLFALSAPHNAAQSRFKHQNRAMNYDMELPQEDENMCEPQMAAGRKFRRRI
jgi:hypothetical protein